MTIERINSVYPQYSPQKANKEVASAAHKDYDKIQISSAAQKKLQSQKLDLAKANLDSYLQAGLIREDVLDKISTKIAAELRSSS